MTPTMPAGVCHSTHLPCLILMLCGVLFGSITACTPLPRGQDEDAILVGAPYANYPLRLSPAHDGSALADCLERFQSSLDHHYEHSPFDQHGYSTGSSLASVGTREFYLGQPNPWWHDEEPPKMLRRIVQLSNDCSAIVYDVPDFADPVLPEYSSWPYIVAWDKRTETVCILEATDPSANWIVHHPTESAKDLIFVARTGAWAVVGETGVHAGYITDGTIAVHLSLDEPRDPVAGRWGSDEALYLTSRDLLIFDGGSVTHRKHDLTGRIPLAELDGAVRSSPDIEELDVHGWYGSTPYGAPFFFYLRGTRDSHGTLYLVEHGEPPMLHRMRWPRRDTTFYVNSLRGGYTCMQYQTFPDGLVPGAIPGYALVSIGPRGQVRRVSDSTRFYIEAALRVDRHTE